MYFTGFSSPFPIFFKIFSNYLGGSNFLVGTNFLKWLVYFWSSSNSVFQYFNLKSRNSMSSLIRLQCVLHDLLVFFSVFLNSLKLWRWELVSGGTNSAEQLNYLLHLLYSIFKNLKVPNCISLINFQCIYSTCFRSVFDIFSNLPQIKQEKTNLGETNSAK